MSGIGRPLAITIAFLCAAPNVAPAQRFGPQVSVEMFAVGVGARGEFRPVRDGRLANVFLATSVDLSTADCAGKPCSSLDVNANVAMPVLVSGKGPYFGLGLGVREVPGNPEPVLNLVGGLRGRYLFGETRINNETLVVTIGILFPTCCPPAHLNLP